MNSIGYGYPFTPPYGFGTGSLAFGDENEDHIVKGYDFTK